MRTLQQKMYVVEVYCEGVKERKSGRRFNRDYVGCNGRRAAPTKGKQSVGTAKTGMHFFFKFPGANVAGAGSHDQR